MLSPFSRALCCITASVFASALITTFSATPVFGDVLVVDDDMSNASYSNFSFNGSDSETNFDDISFSNFDPSSSGGNPDDSLIIRHLFDVIRNGDGEPLNGDGNVFVQSFFIERNVTYNPFNDGFIRNVSFSLDFLTADPFDLAFFGIQQSNGSGSVGGFTDIAPSAGWQTVSANNLTGPDINDFDFEINDELSFVFGFISSDFVFNSSEAHSIVADNFRVELNVVPEPSSIGFLLATAVVFVVRRRRRTFG